MRRRGFTAAELAVMIALFVVVLILMLPTIGRLREGHRRADCQQNLKMMGIAFKMYASEDKDERWPGLRRCAGTGCSDNVGVAELWVPDGPSMYPDYLTDVSVLFCPSDGNAQALLKTDPWSVGDAEETSIAPCKIAPVSYTYLPWVFLPEVYLADPATFNSRPPIAGLLHADFVEKVSAAVQQMAAACESCDFDVFDQDIVVDAELEDVAVRRLREGVERYFITDINGPAASSRGQGDFPVMYDAFDIDSIRYGPPASHHTPMGANVLFMDGHVEFIRFPSEFPVCTTWPEVFAMLTETK